MTANQARTNQGGSVAPFIIGAVILLVVAVGAMVFLHKRTSTNPTTSPIASNSPSASVSPSATPNPSQSPSSSPSISVSPQPTQSPQPSSQPGTNDSALPATGPSNIMPAGLVLATFVGFAVSFIRSRIDKATSLSK